MSMKLPGVTPTERISATDPRPPDGATLPRVSIIVPCRQEVESIGRCLDSILAGDYPLDRLEILVVDGLSDDGTREVVERYAREFPCVKLVENPRRTTPAALNTGIRLAAGEVIMRVDAHAFYPPGYVSQLVSWLDRSGADNVGGVIVTRPGNAGAPAVAIAQALSHPFGVGNSLFRVGVGKPRFVDTVPFGCYRKSVFERVGLFDEAMVRNQDDEFNMRLIRGGGRILLVPDVRIEYVARDTMAKVAGMAFQYGSYKPLGAAKLGGIFTLRQLVPPVFVLCLLGLAIGSLVAREARMALSVVTGFYLAAGAAAAMSVRERTGLISRALMLPVFATLHVSYGIGYLVGLGKLVRRHKESADADVLGVRLTR
jgi:cellulose synthase/poly-beta-1,6-N-acetylglucosamine synthase-like glycosyltransferase